MFILQTSKIVQTLLICNSKSEFCSRRININKERYHYTDTEKLKSFLVSKDLSNFKFPVNRRISFYMQNLVNAYETQR